MTAKVRIIGGGQVGSTMAIALGLAGFEVDIFDKAAFSSNKEIDPRTTAIAPKTAGFFRSLGLWQEIEAKAGAIREIRIVDGKSPFFLHFEDNLSQKTNGNPMGYIVENDVLRSAFSNKIKYLKNVKTHAKSSDILDNSEYSLTLICEGKFSENRDKLGVTTKTHDYRQTAMLFLISHEEPHNNVAIERFLPSGPLAVLPMHSANQSAIVWTESTEAAEIYKGMEEAEFLDHFSARFGNFWGNLRIVSPRLYYPLKLITADRYYCAENRAILLGDAAHAIHPIAGQGFNLSVRDVILLVEMLINQAKIGLDIGSSTLMQQYQRQRRADNTVMIAATHCLTHLFSNNIAPIKLARGLGLGIVQKTPFLKQKFVEYATGVL